MLFGAHLFDSSINKPLGRFDDVLIVVTDNYVPDDFLVMDIECDPSCTIILGRPFLCTVGDVIGMKEGNIRLQFPIKKGMQHFPRKNIKLPFESVTRKSILLKLTKLDLFASCLAQRRKRKRLLGGNPICFYLLFLVVLMFVTTVETSLYLYFPRFLPSLSSDGKRNQKF